MITACAPIPEIEEHYNISYDDRYDITRLDIYLPDDNEENRPAIMLIHGGGWNEGDRKELDETAIRLAGSGYFVACIGYRLGSEGQFPAAVNDCFSALGFLQNNAEEYGIDPERIVVGGYSAGGHLASLIAVSSDIPEMTSDSWNLPLYPPAAVINAAGPNDAWDYIDSGTLEETLLTDFVGSDPADSPELYDLVSPIYHVKHGLPPFLLIYGSKDKIVPASQGKKMRNALREEDNQAELLIVKGGGHVLHPTGGGDYELGSLLDTPEAWIVLQDFLDRTVGTP